MQTLQLNKISERSVPGALAKARHYRSLQEPEQAESICLDIIEVDSDNHDAQVLLILALTDQFSRSGQSADPNRPMQLINELSDEYERLYYTGLVSERRGRALLGESMSRSFAWEHFREAMEWYERAWRRNSNSGDDAILRWNTCLRTIRRERLEPRADRDEAHVQMEC